MSTTTLDLQQLAVNRQPQASQLKRPRRIFTRYVLPLSILAGFVAVIAWAAKDSLLSAQPVTVVPVMVTRAEFQQEGAPLFRTAGWIEPCPAPTLIGALAEGVVDQVLVVEGTDVRENQVIARLIDEDAKIALNSSQVEAQLAAAELARAQATLTAAQTNFDNPLQLRAGLAEADSAVAKVRTELENLPFAIESAKSRLELAEQELQGKLAARDAVAGRSLQRARSERDSATTALKELEARQPLLRAEADALERRATALREQLERKTDEQQSLAEAKAGLAAAKAKVQQAELAVRTADLRLKRMEIRTRVAGRVLRVAAQPGRLVAGQDSTGGHDSSTVVELYDPAQLQVRADVRLEDVRQVQLGQEVQMETAAVAGSFIGRVLSVTSEADVQKNTLEVKVSVEAPSALIRPEMLAQLTFMAPPSSQSESEKSQEQQRLLIPRPLVQKTESGSFVWVADRSNNTARRQAIELGRASSGELVEVVSGLTALDKLIAGGRESLQENQRIKITGEDDSFGVAASVAMAAPADNSTDN